MQKQAAEALVMALSIQFPEDSHTVYENYSGRGMYGKLTTGVNTDVNPTQVTRAVMNNPKEFVNLDEPVGDFRSDNLGKGYIIY